MAELEPYVRRPVTPYHQLALSTFLESALALGRETPYRARSPSSERCHSRQ